MTTASTWHYPVTDATRDLRLDFLRGFVMLLLLISHFDYFSLYMYLGWERIGVVSSAETFIALAGMVTGMVYGKKLTKDGFVECTSRLVDRSLYLYKLNLFIILSIGLIRYVPWIDSTAVTTFYNPYTGDRYPLYPKMESGILYLIRQTLLLRAGPHQFQIIGLYVVLFLLTPFIFWMIRIGRVRLLLGISWVCYIINFATPESAPATAEIRLTGAQFEYGFPSIAWQILFVHGVVLGYYKKEVMQFLSGRTALIVVSVAALLSVCFIIYSYNHPIKEFANWAQLSFIPSDIFWQVYNEYFQKYKLGIGRLVNSAMLFIVSYAILTRFWGLIDKAFGWFFIPIGQASLYVFFVHVYLLLIVSNTPWPKLNDFWINTAIHTIVIGLIWLMVKRQFLFRWIPR